jgi:hypothetical protein
MIQRVCLSPFQTPTETGYKFVPRGHSGRSNSTDCLCYNSSEICGLNDAWSIATEIVGFCCVAVCPCQVGTTFFSPAVLFTCPWRLKRRFLLFARFVTIQANPLYSQLCSSHLGVDV